MSEVRKRFPKDKNLTIEQAVLDTGYYDIDNNWNSLLTFPQYPGMVFRGRVEVFIFDKNNDVFMALYNNHYRIPGGSIEYGRSHKYQVEQEAKEEARIQVGTIRYTGYSYFSFFKKKYTNYPMHWDGSYNEVYIADFKKWYKGPVKNSVKDMSLTRHGQFIPFEYAINLLNENHQKALNLIPR